MKTVFDEWYDKVKNDLFNFREQFESYCWNDVVLLSQGCLAFREIIISISKIDEKDYGVDPFQSSITIASLCHYIFRRNILKSDTIGIIPENGYHPEQRTSFKCQMWLRYLSEKERIHIQHSANGGEFKIENYRIDGYSSENNTYYEFHGCLFHGCQKCYSPESFNSLKQELMQTTYFKHLKRIKFIKSKINNANLVEIWECEWDKIVKETIEIREMIKNSDRREAINPRDSLFGGRTNAVKLYHKINSSETIKYVDFTSLYPYVQKYGEYPIGHPEIITENFGNIKDYFGLIKCKILPPKKLFFPVIPCRINNKLVFTLCYTCAKEQLQNCEHSNNERSFEGTWVLLEIQEAIKEGYKIISIYQVWNWTSQSKYESSTKTGGLFTDYVNLFLKGKQEADGFPKNVQSDEEKDEYIRKYYDREGVLLDKTKIVHNQGLRSVMKLMLNSFWGRFGMNTNKTQYMIISNPAQWFEMLSDNQYIIHNADLSHPGYIQVFYSHNISMYDEGCQTSVTLAAFVTCQARLKLYGELKKLDSRVLYFDTDSILYVSKKDEYEPALGDYLGDFTDEISKKGASHITEFVSAGPKNYAYKLDNDKSYCTVKGFTLNNISSLSINFDSIKETVLKERQKKIKCKQLKFTRDKINWDIKTDVLTKLYGFVYDKRVLFKSMETLPYGY